MKHYLLDTNILGYLAEFKAGKSTKEAGNFGKNFQALPSNAKLFISTISIGEHEYGCQVYPGSGSNKIELIKKMIDPFPPELCLNVDSNIAKSYYGKLRAKLYEKFAPKDKRKKKHRIWQWKDPISEQKLKVQENDVWIASVAMAHNLTLVTHDKMDAIKDVVGSDLEIVNWISS